MNVKEYLKSKGVAFEVLPHPSAKGGARVAGILHVPGAHFAKTVLLHVNHGFGDTVAVLPAHLKLDVEQAKKLLGGAEMKLGNEQDVSVRCPDCERGVLSPFGSQYGMKTLVDSSFSEAEEFVFEGNTCDEAIRVKWSDFDRIENPLVGHFAVADAAQVPE